MAENYIVINGKKAELTPEQLKALGLETEINPFEREKYKGYYYISWDGILRGDIDVDNNSDKLRHNIANYCTDKEMMEQRALHETLNRLLWRYAMEHGGREIDWSNTDDKYRICYDFDDNRCRIYANSYTCTFGTPYFRTMETAENAIKEIIEPFMAEHPDFKL